MSDLISRQVAIDAISTMFAPTPTQKDVVEDCFEIIDNLPSAEPETHDKRTETHGVCLDAISRHAAIDAINHICPVDTQYDCTLLDRVDVRCVLSDLPSVEPERVWHPVEKPPSHHKDVIVRGVEAIGNVTVHKVMQWDVDTWRPTNYAPSITWTEWSEI